MIVITGAAGFIASAMVGHFLREGRTDLVLVDDFSKSVKSRNWEGRGALLKVDRDLLEEWLEKNGNGVELMIHLGARTDTAEQDVQLFNRLNLHYSQMIWRFCTQQGVPLIYASSAATYGGGEFGFDDDESGLSRLQPLNPYGDSKHRFDLWVKDQLLAPPFWAGLKFFNDYGPNEYHKGRMASVVFHAFRQIQETGGMKLFRSHREGVKNGHQSRDFIYVMDVVRVIEWLATGEAPSGIYNLGTGKARTFLDLTRAVFAAMGLPENVSFVDTPEDIRETYQYFTEARMEKLNRAGYPYGFTSLEAGVTDYVEHFLQNTVIY